MISLKRLEVRRGQRINRDFFSRIWRLLLRAIEEDLDKVANKERLRVRIHADEDSNLKPIHLYAYHVVHGSLTLIGQKDANVNGPDTKRVSIPIDPGSAAVLGGLGTAASAVAASWKKKTHPMSLDQQPGRAPTPGLNSPEEDTHD